jgi:hypothetical protein
MKRYPIGAADVVRAIGALAPEDAETRAALVRALGLEFSGDGARQERNAGGGQIQLSQPLREEPAPAPLPAPSREREFRLLPEEPAASQAAGSDMTISSFEPLARGPSEDSLPRPPLQPLFKPQWARAIVSTMSRARSWNGPPRVADLVSAAARMKPLYRLPASVQETASGADVLVDVGDNMTVFGRDQEFLIALAQRVLGDADVTVFCFSHSPERGVRSQWDLEDRVYIPPRPGWPVLMLTDLGIGAKCSGHNPILASEWRGFAERIHAAGCRVIALVPYPRARWPKAPLGPLRVIQWDRVTEVGRIRSVLGASRD